MIYLHFRKGALWNRLITEDSTVSASVWEVANLCLEGLTPPVLYLYPKKDI